MNYGFWRYLILDVGHCQRLAPDYKKAAKNAQGIVKIGAVNCDEVLPPDLLLQHNVLLNVHMIGTIYLWSVRN